MVVRVLSLVASTALVLVMAQECEVSQTQGTQWQGDSSGCLDAPADDTIQTIGGDEGGVNQEFGRVSPEYHDKPGCHRAFILDYLMPAQGTNVNPGWDWAWIHAASRMDDMDQGRCEQSWTSLRVYGYWTFQGAAQERLLLESYRKGSWAGSGCDFGLPDNVWMSSAYTKVRAATQHGWGLVAYQPHYNYFVTNRG